MSKISQFRSSALTNIDQGGGNKLAGIFPRVGGNTFARAAWARSAYVPVDKRAVVFCINQIGGIGKRKSMFNSAADGVKCVKDTSNKNSSSSSSLGTTIQDTDFNYLY